MGRWSQYDEDDYRLPEGMKRVGYDADSGTYFFRDQDGALWEGPEGAQFGELKRVAGAAPGAAASPDEHSDDDDLEAAPRRADGYQPLAVDADQQPLRVSSNASAYRMVFPFLLLVAVVLLLAIRLVHWPSGAPDAPCAGRGAPAAVRAGDTCWALAQAHGCALADLVAANPAVDCAALRPGQTLCVPDPAPAPARRV